MGISGDVGSNRVMPGDIFGVTTGSATDTSWAVAAHVTQRTAPYHKVLGSNYQHC